MGAPKGSSNNPNGRPPKNRALTEILAKAGAKGRRKHIIAALLWEGAATGIVTFAEDRKRELPLDEWVGIVKFIYQQVDGPPRQVTELTGANGAPIQHEVMSLTNAERIERLAEILNSARAKAAGSDSDGSDSAT
jgi:hypothetical protein